MIFAITGFSLFLGYFSIKKSQKEVLVINFLDFITSVFLLFEDSMNPFNNFFVFQLVGFSTFYVFYLKNKNS
jgi:hypothetical protein